MTESNSSITQGVHHLGLTVPDLKQTQNFFIQVFDFDVVGEIEDYPAVFLSDGTVMLTLWQAKTASPLPFDRHHAIGLHHFALTVRDADALESVHKRLAAAADVEIEFAPESLGDGPTRHLMCAIPGGIRLEVIAPAA